MKAIKSKILSLFLMACIAAAFFVPVYASDTADTEAEYNWKACATDVREEFLSMSEKSSAPLEVSPEYLSRSYEANAYYDRILSYIENTPGELREHFSSAFVNDDGHLVVRLCCTTDCCKNVISNDLACKNALFETGNGSYYETKKTLDAVNLGIAQLQELVRRGTVTDANAASLMDAYPRTVFNEENNTVSVVFQVSPDVENAVVKMKSVSRGRTPADALSAEEEKAISAYNEYIEDFKEYVGDWETVAYDASSESAQILHEATEWRPGRSIFVVTGIFDNTVYGSQCSTGYRALYRKDGRTYRGYVTCGHGNNTGDSVYLSTDTQSTNKIGIILDRQFGGTVDASFISINNAGVTSSNAIYYTSSQPGVTKPGIVLDGTQTTVAKNSLIYKSGQTTYLTQGRVFNTSASGYRENIYFYDLIQADRDMTDNGDSGGVTYICDGNTTYGKSVGIVKGKLNNLSIFIKASNIRSDFGPDAY